MIHVFSIISKKIESFFTLYHISHRSVIRSHVTDRRGADVKRIISGAKLLSCRRGADVKCINRNRTGECDGS
jgi:hypothetical protein